MSFGVDRTGSPTLTGSATESLIALGFSEYFRSLISAADPAALQALLEVDPADTATAMAIGLG